MMCDYCNPAIEKDFEIKEAYNDLRFLKVQMYISNAECIAFDQNDNADIDGYYIDINYCPMCGKKL